MGTLFWVCEKCGAEIDVQPMETFQYRGIVCEDCHAVFPVLNSELKSKESNAVGEWVLLD